MAQSGDVDWRRVNVDEWWRTSETGMQQTTRYFSAQFCRHCIMTASLHCTALSLDHQASAALRAATVHSRWVAPATAAALAVIVRSSKLSLTSHSINCCHFWDDLPSQSATQPSQPITWLILTKLNITTINNNRKTQTALASSEGFMYFQYQLTEISRY